MSRAGLRGVIEYLIQLKMSEIDFQHDPVLLDEIAEITRKLSAGLFVDGTLGGAGHSSAILESNDSLGLIGFDVDETAIKTAGSRLERFGADRIELVRRNFAEIVEVLNGRTLSGFLFDLGVSSHQIDTPDRGFAYRFDGPLDMRMDQRLETTASDIVNSYKHDALSSVIHRNSDERFASRIARAIIDNRPINTTQQLADVIDGAIPAAAKRTGGHPAKRTFQAIRIAVNSEIEILSEAVRNAVEALEVGGIGMVITYHSGEDKVVKNEFRKLTASIDPPGLPVVVNTPKFTSGKPIVATDSERAANPRSESARLRVIERVAA